jgi:hypothetical protein
MQWNTLIAAAALSALVACRAPQTRTTPMASDKLGSFQFTERISDATPAILLLGTITVTEDTVSAELESPGGLCRYDKTSSSTTFIRYHCGEVLLSIDRNQPTRTWYSLPATVMVNTRQCVRYVTTESGRTCAQWGNKPEERRVLRTGRLMLNRVS